MLCEGVRRSDGTNTSVKCSNGSELCRKNRYANREHERSETPRFMIRSRLLSYGKLLWRS